MCYLEKKRNEVKEDTGYRIIAIYLSHIYISLYYLYCVYKGERGGRCSLGRGIIRMKKALLRCSDSVREWRGTK